MRGLPKATRQRIVPIRIHAEVIFLGDDASSDTQPRCTLPEVASHPKCAPDLTRPAIAQNRRTATLVAAMSSVMPTTRNKAIPPPRRSSRANKVNAAELEFPMRPRPTVRRGERAGPPDRRRHAVQRVTASESAGRDGPTACAAVSFHASFGSVFRIQGATRVWKSASAARSLVLGSSDGIEPRSGHGDNVASGTWPLEAPPPSSRRSHAVHRWSRWSDRAARSTRRSGFPHRAKPVGHRFLEQSAP